MDRPFLNRPVDFLPEYHSQRPHSSPINCDHFYHRRQEAIQRKLSHLRGLTDREVANVVSLSLTSHWGERLYGINWNKLDPYFVMSVAWSLGGVRLAVVLEVMVTDPVCYSRGMPDLLFCQAMPPLSEEGEERWEGAGSSGVRCRCCPWNDAGCGVSGGGGQGRHNMRCFVSEVKR